MLTMEKCSKNSLQTMHSKDAYIHRLQYSIKREIFKPVFMNFPSLDRLGLPSRERARKLAAHFTDQLVAALKQSVTKKSEHSYKTNPLPAALLEARDRGTLTEQQLRDNITVLFVAGQENTQLAILSTMYLLAKHPVSVPHFPLFSFSPPLPVPRPIALPKTCPYQPCARRENSKSKTGFTKKYQRTPPTTSAVTPSSPCPCWPPPCTRASACWLPSASWSTDAQRRPSGLGAKSSSRRAPTSGTTASRRTATPRLGAQTPTISGQPDGARHARTSRRSTGGDGPAPSSSPFTAATARAWASALP